VGLPNVDNTRTLERRQLRMAWRLLKNVSLTMIHLALFLWLFCRRGGLDRAADRSRGRGSVRIVQRRGLDL
jgi:hypothetical protein